MNSPDNTLITLSMLFPFNELIDETYELTTSPKFRFGSTSACRNLSGGHLDRTAIIGQQRPFNCGKCLPQSSQCRES